MRVMVNGVPHNVAVGHYVGEFLNSAGESRKQVTAVNLHTLETKQFDTYENPVTEAELMEFLEIRNPA